MSNLSANLPGEWDVVDHRMNVVWHCKQVDALLWDYRLRDSPAIPLQRLTLRANAQDFKVVEQLHAALLEALRKINGLDR